MEQCSPTPHRIPTPISSRPVRSRRVNRLDNALEDARVNAAYIAPWAVRRQTELGSPEDENPAADQLRNVYDRIEQRNSASTLICVRTTNLSVAQLQSAQQAVETFVAKMRQVASNEDAQTKENMVRALTNDVVALGVSADSPAVLQQNQADVQPDDITCWYAVGKEIGRGTFGRVRQGTHRLSGTAVAIKSYARLRAARSCLAVDAIGKRVTSDSGGDALEWRRVRQEVNMLSRLRPHPNIMRFVEVFETPTRIHAVTELVRGTSLCDVLRRAPGQRLTETRAKRIFCQLAAAVEALHAQRVIHRDLKLENILLDERSGQATIIDFGFSDFEDTDDFQALNPAEDSGSKKQAKKKNFCGTPSYMAPEVVTSERYDGRPVDMWSLGVLLYVMLCGKFPFQGASFHHLYQKLRSGAQQLVLPPTLSPGARGVLQAVLIVDPVKRPSAGDLRCYLWLQDVDNPQTTILYRRNTAVVAFEAWGWTRQAVCTALAELYGLQLNPSDLEQNSKYSAWRRSHLCAFVTIATLISGRHFQKIVDVSSAEPSPLLKDNQQQQEAEVVTERIGSQKAHIFGEPSSSRHKQELEKLIGLVKTSLAS